jgi:uncharacterized protein YdhG (YjbR/CyaY superfamily)
MDYKSKSIDEYLSKIEPRQRTELEQICSLVNQLVPSAEETMSYGMPTFKYKDQPLVYLASFKNHMSFFPAAHPIEVLKDKLKEYKVTNYAIQFTVDKPLPETLIQELVHIRVQDIETNKHV